MRKLSYLLVLPMVLVACQPPAEKEEDASQPTASLVEVAVLGAGPFIEEEALVGVTEPVKAANVTPELPGRILRLELEEGQRIEAGVSVVTLDTSSAKAQIDRIRVQIAQLDRDIERTEALIKEGLATKTTLEQLQSQRAVMKESVDEVKIVTRQAHTKTPIKGIVTETYAEPGEYAAPGVPLARIVDIDTIVVRVGLPEHDIVYVREGQTVDVKIEAIGEHFAGKLKRIGVEADERSRTFPLEVHVDNSDGKLRAGMRATVKLVKREIPKAVVIPRDAILQALGGPEVFVMREGVAHSVDLELGPGLSSFVLVKKGLQSGDKLVVRGHRTLVEGEPIEAASEEPCCVEQLQAYQQGRRAQPQPELSPSERPPQPDEDR